MSVDNALLLGVIFIIIGIAFGLLAYAIILSRRAAEAEDESGPEIPSGPLPVQEASVQPVTSEEETTARERSEREIAQELGEPSGPSEASAKSQAQPQESASPDVPAGDEPSLSRRIPIASLFRDEETGDLIIQVEEREYRSPDQLRESGDWARVSYAASDLIHWTEEPTVGARAWASRPSNQDVEEAKASTMTMIQQIDAILTRKLAESGSAQQAVRLTEGQGGSVKVYIGVDSYSVEEVPDQEIRRLIREAVEEWEGSQ